MNNSPKSILCMLHLPPPVHGSSVIGGSVKESVLLNSTFSVRYINLILSRKVNESGKISPIKMVRFAVVFFRLLGKLLFRKPDLCYFALTTTGAGFYKDVLLAGLLRLFRVKTVYHIHNRGIAQAGEKKLNHILYRFVFRNTPVILLSKHLYYDVEPYVPENRVYYCPNGIKDYQSVSSLIALPRNTPFHILFFSNLMKEKGVFVLVDACSVLKERGYSFQCDFVGGEGDVNEKQFNEYVRERGLAKQVKYLGKRYGSSKAMIFERADVFVLPSQCDCFPLVILEAMRHNLPVISVRKGGMPDMVEEGITGFLLPRYDDAEALAGKLIFLFTNPELRERMGANGRKKYEESFTFPVFEERLLFILQEIIR